MNNVMMKSRGTRSPSTGRGSITLSLPTIASQSPEVSRLPTRGLTNPAKNNAALAAYLGLARADDLRNSSIVPKERLINLFKKLRAEVIAAQHPPPASPP